MTSPSEPIHDDGVPAPPEDASWEPLPFGNMLSGHLMTSLIGGAVAALLMWGAGALPLVAGVTAGVLVAGVICGWILYSGLGSLSDRAFAKSFRHDSPGSWSRTMVLVGIAALSGLLSGLVIGRGEASWLVIGCAAFLVGYGI